MMLCWLCSDVATNIICVMATGYSLQHTPATYFFINILPFRIQIEWSGSKFGLLIVIGIKWCIAKCQDDTLHGVKLSKAPSSLTRWTNYVKFLTGQWSSEIFINNSIFSKGHIIRRFPSNMWGYVLCIT